MSTVIGHTTDGRELLRHAPPEGLDWRCTTCGEGLPDESAVHRHWASYDQGHSVLVHVPTGRTYHRTIEGLFGRDGRLPAAVQPEAAQREETT